MTERISANQTVAAGGTIVIASAATCPDAYSESLMLQASPAARVCVPSSFHPCALLWSSVTLVLLAPWVSVYFASGARLGPTGIFAKAW
jgi:hypothetical protein